MPTPCAAQRRDDAEQASTSGSVSDAVGSSRISDPGLRADRLGDLDDLLLRHAERRRPSGRDRSRSRRAPSSSRARARARLPIDLAPDAAGFERERDVLGDGQVGKERGLLIDRRDAERAGERRAVVRDGVAGDRERSRVRRHGAGDRP